MAISGAWIYQHIYAYTQHTNTYFYSTIFVYIFVYVFDPFWLFQWQFHCENKRNSLIHMEINHSGCWRFTFIVQIKIGNLLRLKPHPYTEFMPHYVTQIFYSVLWPQHELGIDIHLKYSIWFVPSLAVFWFFSCIILKLIALF